MRGLLALTLAALLAATLAVDRVACPDGCTGEDSQHAAGQSVPSPCGLCHGWTGASPLPSWQPALNAFAAPPTCCPPVPDAPPLPIDHPPRSA